MREFFYSSARNYIWTSAFFLLLTVVVVIVFEVSDVKTLGDFSREIILAGLLGLTLLFLEVALTDLDRWDSSPFEPTVRDGAIFARGASDDKGNLFMLLVAVQRLYLPKAQDPPTGVLRIPAIAS